MLVKWASLSDGDMYRYPARSKAVYMHLRRRFVVHPQYALLEPRVESVGVNIASRYECDIFSNALLKLMDTKHNGVFVTSVWATAS